MISVICPTRKRAAILRRMVESMRATAVLRPLPEVVLYIDDDDIETVREAQELDVKFIVGPRIILTQCWNECLSLATGSIFMQANDDIVFKTNGWDALVENAFAACADKILLVHGSDEGQHYDKFGPHPFIHKAWIDAIGYFIPPYFSSDFGDAWLNIVAELLQRRVYVPAVIEHMHFMFNKAKMDSTYEERLIRHKVDNVEDIWNKSDYLRYEDAKKLAAIMLPPLKLNNPFEKIPIDIAVPKHLNMPVRGTLSSLTDKNGNEIRSIKP